MLARVLRALPGVDAAGSGTGLPPETAQRAYFVAVTSDYFRALGAEIFTPFAQTPFPFSFPVVRTRWEPRAYVQSSISTSIRSRPLSSMTSSRTPGPISTSFARSSGPRSPNSSRA